MSALGSRVSLGFRPWDIGLRVSAWGFRLQGFGLGVTDSLGISPLGFLPWDFGFRVDGFGIRL